MAGLNADQRHDYHVDEATRTGIHQSILAALYAVQRRPSLSDGEVGLGIAPANRVAPTQVDTYAGQVHYAASTVRSITDKLTAQGWQGTDIWEAEQGRYSDRFIQAVASGYVPPPSDPAAARLEPTDARALLQVYLDDLTAGYKAAGLSSDLSFLDPALLRLVEQLPRYYIGLSYQREALLEAVRLWRKLNTREEAIAALLNLGETESPLTNLDETKLDQPLAQFIQQISPVYASYPHQREALIRLTQLWRQLGSREQAIASLETNPSAETSIRVIDSAVVAFVQRIPQAYQGKGDQRNALTETFRLWQGLETRTAALNQLGIDPQMLTASNPDRNALINAATQLDRLLIEFIKRVPAIYRETDDQREALLRLVQLWQGLDGRDKAIQSLLDQLRRMEQARPSSPDAPPRPEPAPLPPRPSQWTPDNLQLHVSIIPNGNFTWAEATQGGMQRPDNQAAIDAIARMAELAQQAYNRIGRPFRITNWYQSSANPALSDAPPNRHTVGDAIDFYCDGLTGSQLYHALDPWWTGGLGRYTNYPDLCYLDAGRDRVRWTR
jgi:hypothetical protein